MKNLKISVLQNASRAEIKYDPVPHIVIKNCLPNEYYDLLEKTYISDEELLKKTSLANPRENIRVSISFDDIASKKIEWQNSQPWHDFVSYHLSENFFCELLELFGPEIKTICPQLEVKLGTKLEKVSVKQFKKNVTNNYEDSKSIFLDGDFGINTKSSTTSSVRTHHVDRLNKIFAGILYFKKIDDDALGGDLEFYRLKYDQSLTINRAGMKSSLISSVYLKPKQVEFVSRIKYAANTAVFWVNSPSAIHGVSPRTPSKISRRLVYFTGSVDDKTLFNKGLYPHAWPEQEYWFLRIYKDLNPQIIHMYYRIKQLIKKLLKI